MSAWYTAHGDELLIDLDKYDRPVKGGTWGEVFFRRRLREAIEAEKLDVREVWLIPSNSDGHYHAIVRLWWAIPDLERLVWQLHLGSDLYRGRADLMRLARGVKAPSLLIRDGSIPGFYRQPDARCTCEKKHVTAEQAALGRRTCTTWLKHRGATPWELFGRSYPGREESEVPLPDGDVPLDLIRKTVILE